MTNKLVFRTTFDYLGGYGMNTKAILTLVTLTSGIICFLLSAFIGTDMKPNGIIIEPYSFLIPISLFFLLISLISGSLLGYLTLKDKTRK